MPQPSVLTRSSSIWAGAAKWSSSGRHGERITWEREPFRTDRPALSRAAFVRRRQSKLVILVTPEIIAPFNSQQVPEVPGEDYATPSDYELYALGLLEGEVEAEKIEVPAGAYRTGALLKVAPLKSQPDEMSLHGPWGY